MASIDLAQSMKRARFKYEWARARHALLGLAPVLVIVALAAYTNHRPLPALVCGGAMFVLGALLLWYGRDLKRAVLPGIGAGLVPLVFALCANRFGHVCTGSGCVSMCIPACTAGGLIAGLVVAAIGHHGKHGMGYWAAGSTLALLTGAMGCSCVGYSGMVGLAVGFGLGFAPMLAKKSKP